MDGKRHGAIYRGFRLEFPILSNPKFKTSHAGDAVAGDRSGHVLRPGEGDRVWQVGPERGDGCPGHGQQAGGGQHCQYGKQGGGGQDRLCETVREGKAEFPSRRLEARRGQAGEQEVEFFFRSVPAGGEVLRRLGPVPERVEGREAAEKQ